MPKKRKSGKRRAQNGAGLWDVIKSVGKVANQVAKQTGVLGEAAKFIPGVGNVASAGLKMAGYGRRRKPGPRRQRGRGPVSGILSMFGLGAQNTSGNLGKMGLGAQPRPSIPL